MKKIVLSNKQGFSVMELLMVIAIIGLILAISTISISNVNAKKRDTIRMTNMNEIFKALNLYMGQNSKYPIYTGNITGSDAMSTPLQSGETITRVPIDPLSGSNYTYTSADGTTFILGFCLETNTINGYAQGCGNQLTP